MKKEREFWKQRSGASFMSMCRTLKCIHIVGTKGCVAPQITEARGPKLSSSSCGYLNPAGSSNDRQVDNSWVWPPNTNMTETLTFCGVVIAWTPFEYILPLTHRDIWHFHPTMHLTLRYIIQFIKKKILVAWWLWRVIDITQGVPQFFLNKSKI